MRTAVRASGDLCSLDHSTTGPLGHSPSEVQVLIDTWTSRNLDERILVKIANDVLGVKVPGGWK